ncbi:MAG: metallophosphoesterase [Candidatus Kapaibacteriota bacterium]
MKSSDLFIFLSIVLTIYTAANYYVFRRAYQALPDNFTLKLAFIVIFFVLYASYFTARFLEKASDSSIITGLIWIGSIWLAALLYFFLIVLMLDVLRLINHYFHIFPAFLTLNWGKTKQITLTLSIISVFLILTIGYFNNLYPSIKRLNITIPKKSSQLNYLKIVLASDIHLGTTIQKQKVIKLVELINNEKPDIVLFAGDILDEDPQYVIRTNLGNPLKQLSSKYGIYAITGNHEYIGGVNNSANYIKSLGINLLRDSIALIDNNFYLIGREDLSANRWSKTKRKDLSDFFLEINKNLPVILMDHQPFNLRQASEYPIDLQVSGHTHHGQLFPFNFITKAIYEKSYGYLKINNTNFFVSSGYGLWGPPIRTINRPEIVVINLNFQ